MHHIWAKEARYIPKSGGRYTGGWLLTETIPFDLPDWKEPFLEIIQESKFFLHTELVDFDYVTRNRTWYQFASTYELFHDMKSASSRRLAATAMQLHLRLTLPLLTFIMVLMGLAIILKDPGRNVFLNAGFCLVQAGLFYGSCYFCRYLGDYEYLTPALAAWLPVLAFGPIALAMLDAIHT
jgi:lipopolysaccharide export system permease protein